MPISFAQIRLTPPGVVGGLASALVALLPSLAAAQLPATSGWAIRYSAVARAQPAAASEAPPADPASNSIAAYDLSFRCRTTFVADKDGKFSLASGQGRFHHEAGWTTAGGKDETYRFVGEGMLRGSGQLEAEVLALQLEWASGPGQGAASGKPIARPVAAHSGKSQWRLQPAKFKIKFGSGQARDVPGYVGSRRSEMPQQLAGCPPLPLVERVEVFQLPTADLAVTAVSSASPGPDGQRRLLVTVKNLGPDPGHGIELRLLLPEGAKIVAPPEHENERPGLRPLAQPLADLAKGASAKLDLAFENGADAKDGETTIGVEVSTGAYDPNLANDGQIEQAVEKRIR